MKRIFVQHPNKYWGSFFSKEEQRAKDRGEFNDLRQSELYRLSIVNGSA